MAGGMAYLRPDVGDVWPSVPLRDANELHERLRGRVGDYILRVRREVAGVRLLTRP